MLWISVFIGFCAPLSKNLLSSISKKFESPGKKHVKKILTMRLLAKLGRLGPMCQGQGPKEHELCQRNVFFQAHRALSS